MIDHIFRKLRLFKKGKYRHDVIQISTMTFAEAKEKREVLRDVLRKTLDHCTATSSSPIVVHSSTGQGVTGVFIALFKLRDDFYNTEYISKSPDARGRFRLR